MSRFLNGIKSFVHSISTSDHYASYDPSRPQGQEDTAPLAATQDGRRSSSSSMGQGYVPGLRSAQMSSSTNLARGSLDGSAAGVGTPGITKPGRDSIPLSDLAPVPSPELSWQRIDTWIEQNYPELYDQILEGATANDLNDLEHDLDCSLPADVRESFEVHDGQERGGKPTGIFFGIVLLDLEGISEEWNVWRRAALKIEELSHRSLPQKSSLASSSASARHSQQQQQHRHAWIEQQRSCPPEAVQPVYAHPSWIPLAKDIDGNNIAVDLSPGPRGRYGQVILFGRDFDTKYVVAPSWGDFLAQFAADIESGQCFIDEDIENAVFAFKENGRLVSYFAVLRTRVERTLPRQVPPQQPRRSMSNITSVSQAPVNSGRVTPRLVSPGSSSTNLSIRDPKSRRLAGQLNEIDLNDIAPSKEEPAELDTHKNQHSLSESQKDAKQSALESPKGTTESIENLEISETDIGSALKTSKEVSDTKLGESTVEASEVISEDFELKETKFENDEITEDIHRRTPEAITAKTEESSTEPTLAETQSANGRPIKSETAEIKPEPIKAESLEAEPVEAEAGAEVKPPKRSGKNKKKNKHN